MAGGHAWVGGCGRGVHGRGGAWQGACMAGACVAGGMHRGACMVGGVMWQGGMHATHAPPPDTMSYGQSMRGRYASYWNALL